MTFDDRGYQDEAFQRAIEHDGYALFCQQRTGKTVIACRVVEHRKPDWLLIACPKIAVASWEKHLPQFDIQAQIQIITLESMWANRRKLKRYFKKHDESLFVIVDESHRIKERTSKVSRALRQIGRLARWRLALTGTPIDKPEDAWAQMDFVDPELFGEWRDFESRYLKMGGFKGYKVVGYRNEDEYAKKFNSRFFRVLLEDVKPVPTQIDPDNIVRFDLVESRPYYDEMESKFIVELKDYLKPRRVRMIDPKTGLAKYVKKRHRVAAPMAITQGMKLHQLAGGFIKDDEGNVHRVGDEKLLHCGALILALGDVPVVIFVRFLPELYRIGALCKALGRSVLFVSGRKDHKWQGEGSFHHDVAVVQIRSGMSIDLSMSGDRPCEEMIFYTWNYSYLDFDQAMFRNRSYTSVRARCHFLIANNTIDEDLHQVVTEKQQFAKLYVDKYRRK